MTTENLTWSKAKDYIVLGIGGLLVTVLALLLRGQAASNATLAEVRMDLAVLAARAQRDREDAQRDHADISDLKARMRVVEERKR